MTPELRDLLQRELSDLKNRKVISKNTDNQLLHYEKLRVWGNSDDNKIKNRETYRKEARFTMDEVKEIRDRFYYGEPITITDLCEQWGNRVAHRNFSKMISGEKYKLDEWTYPDYEERKKEYQKHWDNIYTEDILSDIGSTNFQEKWNVGYMVYYKLCRKIGYKQKRYGCNRPPM
jgi:hypothetical protein